MRNLRTVLTLSLAATAGAPGWAQQPPVFGTGVEGVFVDAFVTRGGSALGGLQAAHFELKDNGVPQRLELLATESQPLRVVLVFDTSSSLAGERLQALRAAGRTFLEGLNPADQASLVTFSEELGWRVGPTADKAALRSALDELQVAGATAVFDALYAGIVLSEPSGRALVVLFSDGEDNSSILDAKQVRLISERSNALVHVVSGWRPRVAGASEPDDLRSLREIADASGGRFWAAESAARLSEAFASIADAMRHRYVLRYEPAGVERVGWHRIEVRLRGRKGEVQTRRGYWVAR